MDEGAIGDLYDPCDLSAIVHDTLDALVAVLDNQGCVLSFNRACVDTTGYSFEDVKGRPVWDVLIPEEQVETVKNVFYRLSAGQFPSKFENHWLTADGSRRLIAWSNNCALDEHGRVKYVISTGIDITDQRQLIEQLKHAEEEKNTLLNSTAEAIYGVDANGACVFVNQACLKMLGYEKASDLVGKNMHAMIHHTYPNGESYPAEKCHVRLSTLQGEITHVDQEVHWRADGTSFPVEYWSRPMFKNDRLVGAVVTFVDITERKNVEEQLLKLSSAIEQAADAISITDADGTIEYVNPAFENLTGYSRSQVTGKKVSIMKSGKHSDEFYQRAWQVLEAGNVFNDVFVNRRRDGSMFYEEKTIAPIFNADNRVTHYVATGRDISDRVETEKQLEHMAHHDVLTGLPNRTLFLDRLKQALARARWHERTVAVLFVDLDRFKDINDTLGHEVGDALLHAFAERLQVCLRERDTIARFGGDEFVILLDDIAHEQDVELLAQKIIVSLAAPFELDEREFHISASIGVSLFPQDGEESDSLLRHADLAMYRAKDDGRNHYEFYSAEMTAHAFERLDLENRLREAIDRRQFEVYYQPQVDIIEGRVIGVESLLRWKHPQLGLVGPEHFISALEETGLIVSVEKWLLETACSQMAEWRSQGFDSLRLVVNISSRQIASCELVNFISTLIDKYSLPAHVLELEITENMMMSQQGFARELYEDIVDMGVRLAINDFGTGSSSLVYLKKLSVDTLKIDRSFVSDLSVNEDSGAIVDALVHLGRSLALNLVAEGVETEKQLVFLRDRGCHIMQGYLFCKPVPGNEIVEFIRSQPAGRYS